MTKAVEEISKLYKNLVEKEFKDICDLVIKKGTVPYFGKKYIYVESFIKEANEYISANKLPIEEEFIENYLIAKIREEGLDDLNTSKMTNKYINFFNKHLFEKAADYIKSVDSKRNMAIVSLKSFLNFLTIRVPSIFSKFTELKTLLDDLGVNPSSQLDIFLETIATNYSCFSQPNFYVFELDYDKMPKHKFKYLSKSQIVDLIRNNKVEKFLADENPALKDAQDELLSYMEENCTDVTHIQKYCVLLTEMMNKDVRTEEDNTTIKECMENLSFSGLTYRLLRYLDHKNENNNISVEKEENVKEEKENKQEIETPKKPTLLNQTLREINKYFNMDTKEIKELLSMDQIIYVLSLMYSINLDNSIIEVFLRNVVRELKKLHPYAIYNQAYDKFAYIGQENSEVQSHLEMIEYILSETSIFICPKEKYIETKSLIASEINELIGLTNGNYTYEKEQAKKLLIESKEDGE